MIGRRPDVTPVPARRSAEVYGMGRGGGLLRHQTHEPGGTMVTLRSVRTKLQRAVLVLASLAPVACGGGDPVSVAVSGRTSRTFSVPVRTEFSVTLQTIGPGEYASPPAISSTAVQYLGVAEVGPFVPAGPTQRFRFQAKARGQAILVFHHTDRNAAVEDTVDVR